MSGVKVSDYPTASVLADTDLMYLVQSSGAVKVSKKVPLSTLFTKIFSKSIFVKGINYGIAPQTLTNSGTIDTQVGLTTLICTTNSTFTLPAGTQGDEKIILVENNPSFTCNVSGTFVTTSLLNVGITGKSLRIVFHNGKWYIA